MLTDQPEKPRSVVFGLRSYSGSRTSFLLTAEALLKTSPGLKLIKESSIEVYGPEGSTPGYLAASILGQSRLSVQELVALGQRVEDRLADPKAPKARSSLRLELLWVEGVELKAPGIELPHPELFTRSWAVGTFTRAAEEAVRTKDESRRLLNALQSVQGPHEIDEMPFLAPEVELRREREPLPVTDVWTVQGTDWPDGLAAGAFVLGAIVHEREDPRLLLGPRRRGEEHGERGQVRGPGAPRGSLRGRRVGLGGHAYLTRSRLLRLSKMRSRARWYLKRRATGS